MEGLSKGMRIKRAAEAALIMFMSAVLCIASVSGFNIPVQASGKSEGVMSAVPAADIKIGVVYNGDPDSGNGYSYEHAAGIEIMWKKLHLKKSQIIERSNVSEKDTTAIYEAFRELISSGCDVIFATSYGYMSACRVFADGYPSIIFANCSGNQSNGKNFTNYYGRAYQARYLSGIVAGKNTKTDRLGFVAAKGVENTEVTEAVNAFAMGAYSVNPDCSVYVTVTGSWNDPEEESKMALYLVNQGCDVITQHCDTPAAQYAAARAGISCIGYNSDMTSVVPYSVLTSVVWNWSVYYTEAVRSVIEGTWSGENYYGGMKEGVVGIAALSSSCVKGTDTAVEKTWQAILDGKFGVFDGEIMTNSGGTVGRKGTTLSDSSIRDYMGWYFKNVKVVEPGWH